MLMKLTPGIDFTNIFTHSIKPVTPQSVKFKSNFQYLFTLLGSANIKAAHRTLMKLTPGHSTKKINSQRNGKGGNICMIGPIDSNQG